MRRKIILAVSFICITLAFSACEESCKVCKQVTYDNTGAYISEGAEAEYCGVELIAIDGKSINIGGNTQKWECR